MPYSWITPVTNRIASSYYNYTDVNRVDNNIKYLDEYVNANIGIVGTLTAYTTQDNSNYGTSDLINLLETNINIIKDVLTYDPLSWVTLSESWVGNSAFFYTDANNLEQNLLTLKTNFELIFQSLRFCGTFQVGTDFNL